MASILDFSKPHVLRDEQEFNAAVEEIDRLLDLDPVSGSDEHDRLVFLSICTRSWEARVASRNSSRDHAGFLSARSWRFATSWAYRRIC